jgi:hypothetical protein
MASSLTWSPAKLYSETSGNSVADAAKNTTPIIAIVARRFIRLGTSISHPPH